VAIFSPTSSRTRRSALSRRTPVPSDSPASRGTSSTVVSLRGRSPAIAFAPSTKSMARVDGEPCHCGTMRNRVMCSALRRRGGCRAAASAHPSLCFDGALRLARLQLGETRLDLGELAEVLEALELGVERGCGDLGLALGERLLATDLVLEAAELAGGVEHVDRADRIL